MRGQLPECLGDVQQGQVLEEVHQQVPFGVGRHQHHEGRVTAVDQAFDIDAVVRTQRLFGENDDWIAHGPSVVPGPPSPHEFRPDAACARICPDGPAAVRMDHGIHSAAAPGHAGEPAGGCSRRPRHHRSPHVRPRQMDGGRRHRWRCSSRPARRTGPRPLRLLRPAGDHPSAGTGREPGSPGRHP